MTDHDTTIGVARPGDWTEIAAMLSSVFHDATPAESQEIDGRTFEPDRSLLVRDGGAVVAHAGAYTRELTVPGAVLPAAHVTQVGVAPTHRRRGLLTRLMHRQLREVHAAGREPLAVLWASEGRIYPRFGYGLAAQRLAVEADLGELELTGGTAAPGAGRLRLAEPETVRAELAAVHDRLRPYRPGWSSRDERWWHRLLADPPALREGATARRAVLYEGPDGVDGYALFRTRGSWDHRGPRGEVVVGELAADGPGAYAALWRFLLTVDLARDLSFRFAAVDEPVQHLVDEPRRLGTRLLDCLWLRIVDVPAALAARRYATGVDVVFEVTDDLLPANAGRWRLTGDAAGARCDRTGQPADLACDVRDLAAVYLGGPGLGALTAAGRVRELRPGAAVRAGAAFGWHRAPVSQEIF
ncbi:MAG TPA: GNAT family N-acetyltransferase [Micromonospora sp.]